MRTTPTLRLSLAPSRIAAAASALATIATALLIALLPAEAWLRCFAVAAAGIYGVAVLRRMASDTAWRSIVAIEVAADRRATLIERGGRRIDGTLRPETYVGELVTALVLRPDGARMSRAVAIFPDALRVDDLRRLRVVLRFSATPVRR